MNYSVENVDSLLKSIPEFYKQQFKNNDGTLRLYDLLNWYYSNVQDNNIFKGLI